MAVGTVATGTAHGSSAVEEHLVDGLMEDRLLQERFVDVLLGDDAWVRAEFDAIVEDAWSAPPSEPPAAEHVEPVHRPEPGERCRAGSGQSQGLASPATAWRRGRQRSPP